MTEDCWARKHSDHKAVSDRRRANMTMAVNVCKLYLQTANRQRQTAWKMFCDLYRKCFRTAHKYGDVSGIYVVTTNLYRTP